MTKSLSLPEISLLRRASAIRNQGLASSRAGDVINGRNALDEARLIGSDPGLSRTASIIASSFQMAADAFLQHKIGDYAEAEASLLSALESCRTLREECGYDVEVRRIHLACNIVRVRSFAGRLEDALRLSGSLLRYVLGESDCWPFRELRLASEPDPLGAEEKWAMLDQIVKEVSLLLAKPETARGLLTLCETVLFSKDVGWDGNFSQARVRLLAMRAVVEEDTDGFLENAIIFFWDGPGHMPRAWGEMYADFIYICRNVASESASA